MTSSPARITDMHRKQYAAVYFRDKELTMKTNSTRKFLGLLLGLPREKPTDLASSHYTFIKYGPIATKTKAVAGLSIQDNHTNSVISI